MSLEAGRVDVQATRSVVALTHHDNKLYGASSGTTGSSIRVNRIRVDDKFIYWMTPTAVMRVVK